MIKKRGFTLIELMIVVAIIGIIASLALPMYTAFAEKAKYTEVTIAVDTVKSAMEVCIQLEGTITDCDSSTKIGIDLATAARSAYVDSISITTTTGSITGTGIDADSSTYTLTPSINGNWTKSGSCVANGIC